MIRLSELSPETRKRIMSQCGEIPKVKRNKLRLESPYAEILGQALERYFPGRVIREYAAIQGRRFRIDFAFPAERLAIEFDGYRHHGFSRRGFSQGLRRQNILMTEGWRVLRYTLTDVRDRLDILLEEVCHALGQ